MTKDLRNENRVRVYQCLLGGEWFTRADLAREANVSAATVMRIIDEFAECGVVNEKRARAGALGRRPLEVGIVADHAVTAAVVHEGDWVQAGLIDMRGNVISSVQIPALRSLEEGISDQSTYLIEGLLRGANLDKSKLIGVGVGLPATLDPYENRVFTAPLIGVTEPVDVGEWVKILSQKLRADVRIENDVNALALGEHAARGLGDRADMAYIALGTGIGAGLILRGALWRGCHSRAGEIGYMTGRFGADTPGEGGPLERAIGLRGLEARFGKPLPGGSEQAAQRVSGALAPLIVNLAAALDLELVVLGGRTANLLGDALLSRVRALTEKLSAFPLRVENGISPDPGLTGLGILMRERYLKRLSRQGLSLLRAGEAQNDLGANDLR